MHHHRCTTAATMAGDETATVSTKSSCCNEGPAAAFSISHCDEDSASAAAASSMSRCQYDEGPDTAFRW